MISGLLAAAHHLFTDSKPDSLFALGCGDPEPKRDGTDSAHKNSKVNFI